MAQIVYNFKGYGIINLVVVQLFKDLSCTDNIRESRVTLV
jgi:hypothetical protein